MDTRDSDLGDDSMSHIDEQSDREEDLRDCDSSDEGVNVNGINGTSGMNFSRNSPDRSSNDLHDTPFPPTHPLGMLSNLTALNMGVPSLQSFQQHNDVLEKIKMQVRDMKVGFMNSDFSALHPSFTSTLQSTLGFNAHQASQAQNNNQNSSTHGNNDSSNGFPFSSPTPAANKDASNSSTSSETSNSSQQNNNGWSFEEQFKQVRQLYEINDDPKRKLFLDDLFLFMQKRGTPINRLPIMAKSVLDLYELYNLVIARGGLVDVINKKLWQEIIKGLHLPSSITSAAFTLRTQYMKYLYPYECEKKNLSTPAELQSAIDGNRREGRRTSYGQFESQMQQQLQLPQMQRSPIPNSLQQMSPLSLVTHASQQNQHHHRLMGAPSMVPHDIEQRMLEYIKLFQAPKDIKRPQSPPDVSREALNALEMSRMALWNMYNNTNPHLNQHNPSPPEVQQEEALNLQQTPSPIPTAPSPISIKRERDHSSEMNDYHAPAAKRGLIRSNSDLSRKSSINNNHQHHHHVSNNNNNNNNNISHLTPIKDSKRSESPSLQRQQQSQNNENGSHHLQSPVRHHHKLPNGLDSFIPILNGMQFKIISKESSSTGEQQLVVKLELNGVSFEGTLFPNLNPNSSSPTTSASTPSTEPMISPAKHSSPNDDHKISSQQQQMISS
ncbi:hypothetical protein PVAND_007825 [Polypedilum vanderplanki]|uniref:Uncharacterized protein n=1 Tax=Polypedilum vanderplanki TaxID=319348 RepID=A0A9J6C907_POLVA|nr:hypothetical protein PVAND_007825 [Polypedilum vanderplanki]